MTCKILTDSSANIFSIPGADYVSVPLKIISGDREFTDTENLDVPEMLSFLASSSDRSSTACPGTEDWISAFGEAEGVLVSTITGALSGCYNAARLAAEHYMEQHPGRKAFVLDSLSTGPELELLAEKCADLIGEGLSFEKITGKLTAYHRQTHLLFTLESLQNFVNNGRVSAGVAALVKLLNVKIVGRASARGTLEPLHKCRGRDRALSRLCQCMADAGFIGGRVRIRHTRSAEAAEELKNLILARWPHCDLRVGENRGLCSYYAEQGGILVGFEGSEKE